MEQLVVEGGHPLEGNVNISGAKNAALPLIAATILAKGSYILSNIPNLRDINTMRKLLSHLGIESSYENEILNIESGDLKTDDAPYDLVKTMRASVLVLGPLVARRGHARVSLPGGCAIGARPINLHIKALELLGAKTKIENGYVNVTCDRLQGAHIPFDKVTVTGTANVLMAATLAEGQTIIDNAACEPEILDLISFLIKMGAEITGAGTNRLIINGVSELKSTDHKAIPDRIEAITFAYATLATTGKIVLNNIIPSHLDIPIANLKEAGGKIKIGNDHLEIESDGNITGVDITTAPYPGFATDLQAQHMAAMARAKGVSVISETIFENRFMHVPELMRLGAKIRIEGNTAIVRGVETLSGAPLMATDLRASASLVIAALAANGISTIDRLYHLDRGYDLMDSKLLNLGAKVKRQS